MFSLTKTVVAAIFLCSLIGEIRLCPPADVIRPCRCEIARTDIPNYKLYCAGLTSTTSLERILGKMKDYRLLGLTLEKSSMMYLPSNFLTLRGNTRIEITDTSLINLLQVDADEMTHAESSATEFFMRHNKVMRGFSFNDLSPFKNLQIIVIHNMKLRYPICGNLNFSPNLMELYLIDVGLRRLDDNCLSSTSKLEYLFLNQNGIPEVKGNMFPPSLKFLGLNYNRISSIPEDMFSHMTNLVMIDFRGNQIRFLSEEMFLPTMKTLRSIMILENPLECDCNMKWILKKQPRIYQTLIYGQCKGPDKLERKRFEQLKSQDFYHCT